MKPPVERLKSRTCIKLPAKWSPGTLVDSHSGVSAGNRSSITSSGRQSSTKIAGSNRNPVHTITRS